MENTLNEILTETRNRMGLRDDRCLPDTPWAEMGMDSLDMVEMIMVFEEKYDITIPDEKVLKTKTIREFADVVDDILAKSARQKS